MWLLRLRNFDSLRCDVCMCVCVCVVYVQVLVQVASAMACLHRADIQHCDLKPDNVFFGQDGHVRVADFGRYVLLLGRVVWQQKSTNTNTNTRHANLRRSILLNWQWTVCFAATGISNKSTSQIRGARLKGDTGGFNSVELIGSPGYIIPVRQLLCWWFN